MSTSKLVHDINDANEFESRVLEASGLVLVDFWAEWCGPCKAFAPILDEVAKEYEGKNITFTKLNVDSLPEIATKYGIRSIPTLMLFKGGEVETTKVGALTKGQAITWIESYI